MRSVWTREMRVVSLEGELFLLDPGWHSTKVWASVVTRIVSSVLLLQYN